MCVEEEPLAAATLSACEAIAVHAMLAFGATDDRFDCGAAAQLAFDLFGYASLPQVWISWGYVNISASWRRKILVVPSTRVAHVPSFAPMHSPIAVGDAYPTKSFL